MKIGVIQASSQKSKNSVLFESVKKAVEGKNHEVINFGVFPDEKEEYSYIQTAVCISMLLESQAVDFVVTGCSSGQGMMLACNSLPGPLCGYVATPADAYLFGRINDGNAVSFPLGLNYGWAGEINLQCTLEQLFEEPFGSGYPQQDAARKQKDTRVLKAINKITKKTLLEILPELDAELVRTALNRNPVYQFIMENGKVEELKEMLQVYRK